MPLNNKLNVLSNVYYERSEHDLNEFYFQRFAKLREDIFLSGLVDHFINTKCSKFHAEIQNKMKPNLNDSSKAVSN